AAGARKQPRLSPRSGLPDADTRSRWLMARPLPGFWIPALFRERISTRQRSMDLDGRHRVGGNGPNAIDAGRIAEVESRAGAGIRCRRVLLAGSRSNTRSFQLVASVPRSDFPAPLSSLRSQARAKFQSRITVFGATPNTSAVSSTLKPPKKRISKTLLLRSSL